jgi:hypothetical protein
MAFHYSPNITTNGLIFYMDPANPNSYTGTGLTPFSGGWNELGRNMNSGSLVGGFTYDSTSKSFNVITATATTPAWISINTPLSFVDASEYSMEFSIKFRSNAETNSHSLCGNISTNPWVGISGSPTSWRFFFRDSTAGATYSFSTNQTNYNLSQRWVNLAFTVATDRTIRFYMNGVFISNVVDINGLKPTSTLLNVSRIGGGYVASGNFYPFQGFISTTRIYNKVLTDAEILQNHNTIKSRFGL